MIHIPKFRVDFKPPSDVVCVLVEHITIIAQRALKVERSSGIMIDGIDGRSEIDRSDPWFNRIKLTFSRFTQGMEESICLWFGDVEVSSDGYVGQVPAGVCCANHRAKSRCKSRWYDVVFAIPLEDPKLIDKILARLNMVFKLELKDE